MSETKPLIYNDTEVGAVTYDRIDHGLGQITYDAVIDWTDPKYQVQFHLLRETIGGDFDDRRLHNLTINTVSQPGPAPLTFEYLKNVTINSTVDPDNKDINVNIDNFYYHTLKSVSVNGGILKSGSRDREYPYEFKYNGTLIPRQILENNYDDTSLDMRVRVYQAMLDEKIPINSYNLSEMMKLTHSGDGHGEIFPEQIIKNFKKEGFNPDFVDATKAENRQVFEDYKAELEAVFKENMAGNVPRIIDTLTSIGVSYKLKPEIIVSSFDVQRTKDYIRAGISPLTGATLSVLLDKNTFDRAIRQDNVELYASLADKYYTTGNNMYLDEIKFLINHPKLNDKMLEEFVKWQDFIYIGPNDSTDKLRSEISRASSFSEVARIEKAYPRFRFSDCQFNLKFNDVERDGLKAGIMRPGDSRMATLGYDTHCCQRLGKAGETAMMYGLVYDKAGFWTIEDKSSQKILAQAEIWEKDDKTLVMDNIEFDADRDVSQYAKLIGDWAKESGYENVIMGNGNNTLAQQADISRHEGVEPPVDKKVINVIGNKGIYTDARDGCSVIKQDGVIEPYFTKDHSDRLMEHVKRDAEGHTYSYESFKAGNEHLECYEMLDDIVDAVRYDEDVDDDRIQDIIDTKLDEMVEEKSDIECLRAAIWADGDASMHICDACSYVYMQELLDNIDMEDLAKDCLIEAYKEENRPTETIPQDLLEAIENAEIDYDEDIMDVYERIKEEVDMSGEMVPIEYKTDEDIYTGGSFNDVYNSIEEYHSDDMSDYSSAAEFVVSHCDEVLDAMRELGGWDEADEALYRGREILREEINEHIPYQLDNVVKQAALLSIYESIVPEVEPDFYKAIVYTDHDFTVAECSEEKVLEIVKNTFDDCLPGRPQVSYKYDWGDMENVKFYQTLPIEVSTFTSQGAQIKVNVDYTFGNPIDDITKAVLTYIDQNPDKLISEMIPGQEISQDVRDSFVSSINETIGHLANLIDPDGNILKEVRQDNVIIKAIDEYRNLMNEYEKQGLTETAFNMEQNLSYAGFHEENGVYMVEDPKGTIVPATQYENKQAYVTMLNGMAAQAKESAAREVSKEKEVEKTAEKMQEKPKEKQQKTNNRDDYDR